MAAQAGTQIEEVQPLWPGGPGVSALDQVLLGPGTCPDLPAVPSKSIPSGKPGVPPLPEPSRTPLDPSHLFFTSSSVLGCPVCRQTASIAPSASCLDSLLPINKALGKGCWYWTLPHPHFLLSPLQSGYRPPPSSGPAHIKVTDD